MKKLDRVFKALKAEFSAYNDFLGVYLYEDVIIDYDGDRYEISQGKVITKVGKADKSLSPRQGFAIIDEGYISDYWDTYGSIPYDIVKILEENGCSYEPINAWAFDVFVK